MAAAYEDDFNQLNELMRRTDTQSDAGADVNFTDISGDSPLRIAVQNNNINMFRLLVSHGANVHATPGYHSKIMDLYAADRKLEASVLDLVYENTMKYGSPIGAAIYYDTDDMVKHILDHCEALRNRFLPLGLLFSSPGTNVLGELLSYPRRRRRCRRCRRRQFQVKVFVY